MAADALTTAQVCAVLNVTARRLRQLHQADNAPPRRADGSYDAKALGTWLRARSDPDLRRLRAAKADAAEVALAESRGELLRRADVDQEIGPMLRNLRDEILAIPASVAAEFELTSEQAGRMFEHLRRSLQHIAAKVAA